MMSALNFTENTENHFLLPLLVAFAILNLTEYMAPRAVQEAQTPPLHPNRANPQMKILAMSFSTPLNWSLRDKTRPVEKTGMTWNEHHPRSNRINISDIADMDRYWYWQVLPGMLSAASTLSLRSLPLWKPRHQLRRASHQIHSLLDLGC